MHILYITYDIIVILYMLSSAYTYIYGHEDVYVRICMSVITA